MGCTCISRIGTSERPLALPAMPRFRFAIDGSRPFADDIELPSDEVAWQEALQLVRDIEGTLKPGENWGLAISDASGPVFCIRVQTATLRAQRK
jgi:hypothetical protein